MKYLKLRYATSFIDFYDFAKYLFFVKGGLKGGLFILKTVLFMENMKWKWFFDTPLDLADVLYACLKLYGIIELQTGSCRCDSSAWL